MAGIRVVGRSTRRALAVISVMGAAVGWIVAVAPAASAATCSYSFPADASTPDRAGLQGLLDAGESACPNTGDQVIVTLTSNLSMDAISLTWAAGPLADLTLQGNVTITGDGANRILYAGSQPGVTVTIDGLTITNGGEPDYGAAVYSSGMDLVIRNATFSANHVSGAGAYGVVGSDSVSGLLTVTDSTFTGNGDPDDQGGAIYWEGDVTIADSTFSSNQAAEGGAIWHSTGNLTIADSTFTGNDATGTDGGAIYAGLTSTVEITSSTFTNNSSDDGGGAVSVRGTTTITESTFSGNSTYYVGGAVESYGQLTVVDSTLSSNTTETSGSSGRGGAIRIANPVVLTITGSTITDNTANWGGGISLANSNTAVNVLNSTITGNSATTAGGGIHEDVEVNLTLDFVTLVSNISASGANISLDDGDAVVVVRGSVIGNAVGPDNCSGLSSPWIVTESIIDAAEASSCGGGFTSASWSEIALGALANNGGATQTMMPAATSVLVGFVTDSTATAVTSVDQRAYSRSGAYTAGAVQWNASAPEPDLSQLPPSWYQAYQRASADEVCLPGWDPSWAEWANDDVGGWTCERTIRWTTQRDRWEEVPGFQ